MKNYGKVQQEKDLTTQEYVANNTVPATRTINGKALTEDITLTPNDINAAYYSDIPYYIVLFFKKALIGLPYTLSGGGWFPDDIVPNSQYALVAIRSNSDNFTIKVGDYSRTVKRNSFTQYGRFGPIPIIDAVLITLSLHITINGFNMATDRIDSITLNGTKIEYYGQIGDNVFVVQNTAVFSYNNKLRFSIDRNFSPKYIYFNFNVSEDDEGATKRLVLTLA